MRVTIVVAVAANGVIGKDNALLWRLPDDMKFFKATTMGKPVIMGRKTFDSIGKPLPGRLNIVVSRNTSLAIPGCTVVDSFEGALTACGAVEEAMVIGGAEIYRQALERADTIHLTEVHATFDGDVHFPVVDRTQWFETKREEHAVDERHAYPFSFVTLVRRSR